MDSRRAIVDTSRLIVLSRNAGALRGLFVGAGVGRTKPSGAHSLGVPLLARRSAASWLERHEAQVGLQRWVEPLSAPACCRKLQSSSLFTAGA